LSIMTSCSLVAPGLVSEVSGAVPTFSYRRTAHAGDYFGVQMTYLNGRSTCYQTGALPGFTPVIKNQAAGYTVNCQFITQGTTYTGIYCPPASVTSIPDGVLTAYANPISRYFRSVTCSQGCDRDCWCRGYLYLHFYIYCVSWFRLHRYCIRCWYNSDLHQHDYCHPHQYHHQYKLRELLRFASAGLKLQQGCV
jgi:hypothetical protein